MNSFIRTLAMLMLFALKAVAQDQPSTTANPLPEMKEQVARVLAEAGLPFTEEQDQAIILMMEDRRRAAEDLFGETMDFRAGPTQGAQVDRARDAIQWMRSEFLARLQDYLTAEQRTVWSRYEEAEAAGGSSDSASDTSQNQQQTQYVRINNNAFTSEEAGFRDGGNRTEVIQRGGAGAYHGNVQFLIKDEALNARNPFAHNKPPYQERQTTFDVSGPVIPGRLTLLIGGNHNKTENVDTIHAVTPEGLFDLGIVHPTINQSFRTRGTYQLADAHSLTFNLSYGTNTRKNQGTGGFNLPERASDSRGRNWNVELRQFSTISSRAIYETRFNLNSSHDETIPASNALQINVLDAFRSGGAQNRSESTSRNYQFSNLYTRLGEVLTVKAGVDGVYRTDRSLSEENFVGTYTFSSLQSYLEGRPINFRVNRGNPLLEASQLELAFFMQNDWKVTPRLTFLFGVRYDVQTNLSDYNNLDPRVSIAYAIGPATVLRAGAGIFHQRVSFDAIQTQLRGDGTRQYEIVIDNPSYPDPFQAGTVRNTFPSIRVTDPDLVAPYNTTASISLERTFLNNLLVSATYDFTRSVHRYRVRNLNAPLPGHTERPDPTRGNILNMESTATGMSNTLRLNVRQRFSIFNVSASYNRNWSYDDGQPNNLQNLPSNNYDLHADWSRTPGARHNFNGTVNARMPLGIFLTGTVSAQADTAYTITTGRDDNHDNNLNDRPPGIGRFTERGPGSFTVDLNISKAIFLEGSGSGDGGTRTNINLFANMSNALNSPQLGRPSGVLTSPNFGRSTSASNPREIEAGIRFQF